MKRCPVCTSSRVTNTRNGMHCKRCGYFMYNPNKIIQGGNNTMKNKKGLFTAFGLFLMTLLTGFAIGSYHVIRWLFPHH